MTIDEQIAAAQAKLTELRKERNRIRSRERAGLYTVPKDSVLAPYIKQLGRLTDAEIAKQANCSRERVRQLRKALGISRHKRLDTKEVAEFAGKFGVTNAAKHFKSSWKYIRD